MAGLDPLDLLGSDVTVGIELDASGVRHDRYDHAVPEDGTEVIVGVDMALHHDSVGVVVAGVLPDGRIGWWPRIWEAIDGKIDHADVFATISGAIAQRWKIKAVVYDPRFFELPANLLEDQGFTVIEFPQPPDRLIPADRLLYALVRTQERPNAAQGVRRMGDDESEAAAKHRELALPSLLECLTQDLLTQTPEPDDFTMLGVEV